MSQSEFASALGISKRTLLRYEHDQPGRPDVLSRLQRIAASHGFPGLADRFRSGHNAPKRARPAYDAPFDNALLALYRELPDAHCRDPRDAEKAIDVLKRWGLATYITSDVAAAIANIAVRLAHFTAREHAIRQWAHAIPDEAAIDALVRYSPIVEIGAGTGYWARLASQVGADIVAYDTAPEREPKYFDVRRGGPSVLPRHQRRTLFLCGPPMDTVAADCLGRYTGSTVIHIGEPGGDGDMLDRGWEAVERIDMPSWFGMKDWMFVYRRK